MGKEYGRRIRLSPEEEQLILDRREGIETPADKEIITESVRLSKQKQRFQDLNRVERKTFREYARIENAVEEYTKELVDVFKKNPIQIATVKHDFVKPDSSIGVFQLSDTHFNELVELDSNKYDFVIASKRLQKYVDDAIVYFSSQNIGTVLVAMTGDLLNNDKLLDKLLSNATNRSKATFLAVQILENVIIDLNRYFNVSVASVTGNESRVGKDIGWQHQIASDSYDLTIYGILEYHLKNKEGISFIGGDSLTKVVDVCGYNWLLIHGHQTGFNGSVTQAISKLCRMYADKGIIIRYVIFGHIHEALIADTYARCSSLVGANSYSEDGLMLTSRASQNLYIQHRNGNIDGVKVDLQNFDGYEGYPIQKELEEYNAKSASKLWKNEVIFKVVI
jgi:hypothetical protein